MNLWDCFWQCLCTEPYYSKTVHILTKLSNTAVHRLPTALHYTITLNIYHHLKLNCLYYTILIPHIYETINDSTKFFSNIPIKTPSRKDMHRFNGCINVLVSVQNCLRHAIKSQKVYFLSCEWRHSRKIVIHNDKDHNAIQPSQYKATWQASLLAPVRS